MTPPDLLAAIGRALHGERWIKPLARDLGINELTIRRWLSGHTRLPEDHKVFEAAGAVVDAAIMALEKVRGARPPP